jgi:multiple sugar transport system substrate-binding protein
MIELRGITWNHTRGYLPMVATAQRFSETHPDVSIVWEKRSLQKFADMPVEKLARQFDLLVIDYPSVGAAHGDLVALDEHLPAAFLQDQAEKSVGQSHASYAYGSHQWALAIDAAAPVCGYRADLLERARIRPPQDWEELLEAANRGMVVLPGIAIDCLCHFHMLCVAAGEEPPDVSEETGVGALEMLRALMRRAAPGSEARDPIAVWELLSTSDTAAYCPFAYGYSNYGRASFAEHPLSFGGLIEIDPGRRCRSTLGGAGLAISAHCAQRGVAVEYAQFVASPLSQAGLYFESGGQPGHRDAWVNPAVNHAANGFFRDTLATLDQAWVRPRWPGYLEFQARASLAIHDYLWRQGDAATTLAEIKRMAAEAR